MTNVITATPLCNGLSAQHIPFRNLLRCEPHLSFRDLKSVEKIPDLTKVKWLNLLLLSSFYLLLLT